MRQVYKMEVDYMNDLQVFNYGEREVRTLLIDDDPWWVLVDVCRVLGIGNSRNVAQRLDDDEKNTVHLTDGIRGNPNMVIVNESGLYSVILRSDKAEAKAFKRWITHEVLPTIRKTGQYAVPEAEPRPQLSVETGLQRAGLIIRAAEHKAVPQSEQLRLLDIAVRDLTGTSLNLTPPAPMLVSAVSLMDLPETVGALKKGRTKKARGSTVAYHTLSEIADLAGVSEAEFNDFAENHGLKTGADGEWVRVNTPSGPAREFLYANWVLGTYKEEAK